MLKGIRVVELASYVAGPGACGLLADWGAEVIKVEPKGGDPFRQFFASLGRDDERNAVFETDNRGKRSIALDLADDDDAATMRSLIASADVFVTNSRPASLARIGLDWETLSKLKPNLIFANFTGYGPTGADAERPGFDITAFWARSGLCSLMTAKGEDPVVLRTGVGDHMAALGLAAGVTTALFHRERTGEGQKIETSLLRMGVYAGASEHAIQLQMGKLASTKARSEQINPLNNFFRTADARWFVTVPRQGIGDWPRLVRAVGRPELLDDPRFESFKSRRANGAALVEVLDEAFGSMSFDDAASALEREGLIWGPVLTVAQAAADPQAAEAGCFVEVEDASGGNFRVPNTPLDFGAQVAKQIVRAPRLDEHGAAIRAELDRDAPLSRFAAAAH